MGRKGGKARKANKQVQDKTAFGRGRNAKRLIAEAKAKRKEKKLKRDKKAWLLEEKRVYEEDLEDARRKKSEMKALPSTTPCRTISEHPTA